MIGDCHNVYIIETQQMDVIVRFGYMIQFVSSSIYKENDVQDIDPFTISI